MMDMCRAVQMLCLIMCIAVFYPSLARANSEQGNQPDEDKAPIAVSDEDRLFRTMELVEQLITAGSETGSPIVLLAATDILSRLPTMPTDSVAGQADDTEKGGLGGSAHGTSAAWTETIDLLMEVAFFLAEEAADDDPIVRSLVEQHREIAKVRGQERPKSWSYYMERSETYYERIRGNFSGERGSREYHGDDDYCSTANGVVNALENASDHVPVTQGTVDAARRALERGCASQDHERSIWLR